MYLDAVKVCRIEGYQDEQVGPWRIVHHMVSAEEEKFGELRSLFSFGSRGRYTPAGTYTGLIHDSRGLVMSDAPDELWDLNSLLWRAQGRVLVNGLGLGCAIKGLLTKPEVTHIDVVEIDPDVITLVGKYFKNEARVQIHQGDAFTFKWPAGTRWNAVWHDVWDELCTDNLSNEKYAKPGTYAKLNRRYGGRTDWQGAWCQDRLQHYRSMER